MTYNYSYFEKIIKSAEGAKYLKSLYKINPSRSEELDYINAYYKEGTNNCHHTVTKFLLEGHQQNLINVHDILLSKLNKRIVIQNNETFLTSLQVFFNIIVSDYFIEFSKKIMEINSMEFQEYYNVVMEKRVKISKDSAKFDRISLDVAIFLDEWYLGGHLNITNALYKLLTEVKDNR